MPPFLLRSLLSNFAKKVLIKGSKEGFKKGFKSLKTKASKGLRKTLISARKKKLAKQRLKRIEKLKKAEKDRKLITNPKLKHSKLKKDKLKKNNEAKKVKKIKKSNRHLSNANKAKKDFASIKKEPQEILEKNRSLVPVKKNLEDNKDLKKEILLKQIEIANALKVKSKNDKEQDKISLLNKKVFQNSSKVHIFNKNTENKILNSSKNNKTDKVKNTNNQVSNQLNAHNTHNKTDNVNNNVTKSVSILGNQLSRQLNNQVSNLNKSVSNQLNAIEDNFKIQNSALHSILKSSNLSNSSNSNNSNILNNISNNSFNKNIDNSRKSVFNHSGVENLNKQLHILNSSVSNISKENEDKAKMINTLEKVTNNSNALVKNFIDISKQDLKLKEKELYYNQHKDVFNPLNNFNKNEAIDVKDLSETKETKQTKDSDKTSEANKENDSLFSKLSVLKKPASKTATAVKTVAKVGIGAALIGTSMKAEGDELPDFTDVSAGVNFIEGFFDSIISAVGPAFKDMKDKITDAFSSENLDKTFGKINTSIQDFFKNKLPEFFSGISDFFSKHGKQLLSNILKTTLIALQSIGDLVIKYTPSLLKKIGSALWDLTKSIVTGTGKLLDNYIIEPIKNFFSKKFSDFVSWGSKVFKSAITGLKNVLRKILPDAVIKRIGFLKYTKEELAQQEAEKKKQEAKEKADKAAVSVYLEKTKVLEDSGVIKTHYLEKDEIKDWNKVKTFDKQTIKGMILSEKFDSETNKKLEKILETKKDKVKDWAKTKILKTDVIQKMIKSENFDPETNKKLEKILETKKSDYGKYKKNLNTAGILKVQDKKGSFVTEKIIKPEELKKEDTKTLKAMIASGDFSKEDTKILKRILKEKSKTTIQKTQKVQKNQKVQKSQKTGVKPEAKTKEEFLTNFAGSTNKNANKEINETENNKIVTNILKDYDNNSKSYTKVTKNDKSNKNTELSNHSKSQKNIKKTESNKTEIKTSKNPKATKTPKNKDTIKKKQLKKETIENNPKKVKTKNNSETKVVEKHIVEKPVIVNQPVNQDKPIRATDIKSDDKSRHIASTS